MKYAFFFSFLLTLFIDNNLSAQQTRLVLPLPATSVQSAETQSSSNNKPSGKFELLDLTGDSLVLGYLKLKGGDNERQAVVTSGGKSNWLSATTSGNAAASFSSRANPVLFVLNDISVGRAGSDNYVRLKATVYESGSIWLLVQVYQ